MKPLVPLIALAAIAFSPALAAIDFRSEIAPLLVEHCSECHNPSDQKGDLNLMSEASLREAIEEIWPQIEDDEMPKKRPALSAADKKAIQTWLAGGAKWEGADLDPFAITTNRRAGYDWWSLKPVANPAPPKAGVRWARNEIDRFIAANLDQNGLEPAPEADRRTLIRRVYFDLTGLPPSPEEIESFVKSDDPEAYEKLVQQLLDSPHYGERWARHWLDVIRFGESQGYERNRVRPNAWRFRDWLIGAFNRDLPYDEFVRQQIAGDVLYPDDLDALIATGYHVCGAWDQVGHFEGSKPMRLVALELHREDLVATLGQSFLGLTVNCARCHDHKFDPITQREYYQMAALLGGVNQRKEERSGINLTTPRGSEVREKRQQLLALENTLRERYRSGDTTGIEGLSGAWNFTGDASPNEFGPELEKSKPAPWSTKQPPKEIAEAARKSGEVTIEAWLTPENATQKGPARIFTYSKDSGSRNFTLGQEGAKWVVRLRTTSTGDNGIPELVGGKVEAGKSTHVAYTFRSADGMARLFVNGEQVAENKFGGKLTNWDAGFKIGFGDELAGGRPWQGKIDRAAFYTRALSEAEIAAHFKNPSLKLAPGESFDEIAKRFSEADRAAWNRLRDELAKLEEANPAGDFKGVAHVIEPTQPAVFHILERGEITKPKEEVVPAALGVSGDLGLSRDAPEAERRKQLAAWLSNSDNPLTARVFVNRVWLHHFGEGIVNTPSDFGFNGGWPSHPELLDFLARRFMDSGWKTKELHRLIVTSATYRQASNVRNAKAEKVDSEARLLWRFNARRLEGEAVRDAMLTAGGALNPRVGGPSFRDLKTTEEGDRNHTFGEPLTTFDEETLRRTIYRLWARSGSLPLLEALDCPEPSAMAPRRTETITPIAALSLMNGAFAEYCAARLAERAESETGDPVVRAYLHALGREPNEQERALAAKFVSEHGLEQFCLVLFNANEFVYVN